MSHVHGTKAVASHLKSAASAGMPMMMDSTISEMGPMMMGGAGAMMNEGMSSMMKMGEGLTQVMKHPKTPGVAAGIVASAGSSAGKSVVRKIFTQPLVLFGLGVVVGCCVYKYRQSIISSTGEARQE
ncbi:MAG: hypothetical protein QX198_07535 [Methylococcaceae bacterium]